MIGGGGKRGSAAGSSKPPSSTATAVTADDKASIASATSKNDDKKDETKGKCNNIGRYRIISYRVNTIVILLNPIWMNNEREHVDCINV